MDLTGQKLGKYELVERLGQGGMAEVYKAFQPGVERFVAVKVMLPHLAESDDFIIRFQREAKAVGQLQHTHIMRIIDFDVQDGNSYMVMEFIDGEDLEDYLKRMGGKLDANVALRITDELAGALAYAHERGMVHRDIKPANIMSQGKAFAHSILMDFGIARLAQEVKMTMTGSMVGTPAYMSPEAVRGETVDERTDIYSLGVVLYELVTGRTPFVSDTPYGLIAQQMKDPIPEPRAFNPDVPDQVNRVLMKALAKDADERYQTAKEFQTAVRHARMALGDVSAAQVIDVTPTDTIKSRVVAPKKAPPKKEEKSNMLPLLGAGIGVLVIAGIFLFFLLNLGGNGEEPTAEILPTPTESTQLAADPDPTATNKPDPTATSEPIATATNPPPTDVPSEPTSEPATAPEPEVATVTIPSGFLRFSDNDDARAGTFTLDLSRVPLLPPDAEYVLKVRETGQSTNAISLGTFEPNDDNTASLTLDIDRNLFTDFGVFEVNMVSEGQETPVFVGLQTVDFVVPLRDLLFSGRDKGLLLGAEEQALLAQNHAGFMLEAINAGNLASAKNHAEHVVNILDGADGADFGDLSGDGQTQNPGDGVGVRGYLAEAQEIAFTTFENHGGAGGILVFTLSHADELRLAAQETALKVFATDTAEEAQPFVEELQILTEAILSGADINGDGVIDPNLSEGGLIAAYEQALAWGAVKMNPVDESLLAEGAGDVPTFGAFQINDHDDGFSNGFVLQAGGLLLPAEGAVYNGWLVDDAGIPAVDLGELFTDDGTVGIDGALDSNIVDGFRGILIARQPADETVEVPTDIAYTASFPTDLLPQFRTLLSSEDGLFMLTEAQLDLAIQHGNLALTSVNGGDLNAGRLHAEHVVNILVGAEGEGFGDLNGDGQAQNPGDGFGLIFYELLIAISLEEIATANTLAPSAQFAAFRALDTTLQHQDALNQARDNALQIFATDTAAEAQPIAAELVSWLEEIKNGVDLDDNGIIDPLFLEGSFTDVYRFTQKATTMEIIVVE